MARKFSAILAACVGVAAVALVGNLAINFVRTQAMNAKPSEPLARIATQAMDAKGIMLGHGGPMVIAFEDPNCKYCARFDAGAKALVERGELRVRVVPVAFLRDDSAAMAAGILASNDPAAAWSRNEALFDQASEHGGFVVGTPPRPSEIAGIQANTDLLEKTGTVSTPTVIACDARGVPRLLRGYAPGLAATLAASAYGMTAKGACARNGAR